MANKTICVLRYYCLNVFLKTLYNEHTIKINEWKIFFDNMVPVPHIFPYIGQ